MNKVVFLISILHSTCSELVQITEESKKYKRAPVLLDNEAMAKTDNHARKIQFAEFRFYAELNDFLPARQHNTGFRLPFFGCPTVRDTIQAMGVPHRVIDLILVDGQSVDLSYRLCGGERVAVYPAFKRLDISMITHLSRDKLV